MLRCRRWSSMAGALMLSACAPLIAPYSLQAYTNATSLKAETLMVVGKATDPYAAHAGEVDDLRLKLESAYEFSKGMPKNSEATLEWELLKGQNLLGDFLEAWHKHPLSDEYVSRKKVRIATAFDYLICLEANKDKPAPCAGRKEAANAAPATPSPEN